MARVDFLLGDAKGFATFPKTIIIWPRSEADAKDILAKIKATNHVVIPQTLLKDVNSVSKVIRFGLYFASLGTKKAFFGGPNRPDIEEELKSYGIFIKEE